MKQPYRDMGARIRKTRRLKDLTQQDVSEAVHVSVQSVSQWETGKTRPDRDRLEALAEFLGVHTEYLTDNAPKAADKEFQPYLGEKLEFITERFVYQISNKAQAIGYSKKSGLRDGLADSIIIAQKNPIGHLFAYELSDDDQLGSDFKAGDLVVVDTGLPFKIGDTVLALDFDRDEIQFKQVRGTRLNEFDRTIVDLRPLDPDQPVSALDLDDPENRILGTVVEQRRVRGG